MTFYQPLNLEYWLVNVLSGGYEFFFMLSLVALFILAARLRMSVEVLLGSLFVYTAIMYYATYNGFISGVFLIGCIIVILLYAAIYSKIVGNR